MRRFIRSDFQRPATLLFLLAAGCLASAQAPEPAAAPPPGAPGDFFPGPGGQGGPFGRGQGGFGRGFGPDGGPGGGGVQEDYPLVKKFDKNSNGRLDTEERKAAREFLAEEKKAGRGPRRPGPPGGGRMQSADAPAIAGQKVKPSEVVSAGNAPLYEPGVLRTVFLDFESSDWEHELEDFYHTDVDVPATLTVDGKSYRDVGVHFRGASSFFTVSEGRKRSLNLALDAVQEDQRLGGYRTLNLLNSHVDPSYLRAMLYLQVVRQYLPAPKANFLRVVINGESWGVYVNAQQFNKDFLKDCFQTAKGARWKVPGSPRGNGGLAYLGDDAASYKKLYEIKTKDDPKSWAALIELCRLLKETPAGELEQVLAPKLDIDGVLKFLALENIFINGDGYWTRASDYNLYLDEQGRFHIIPHDANETFRAPEGPGMRGRGGPGGGGGGGVNLSPLAGAEDANKPLLNKLLAAPALKARYLAYVRAITEQWLAWEKIGPLAEKYHALIAPAVKLDTHGLASYDAFERSLADDTASAGGEGRGRGGMGQPMSLKKFIEQRRAYLLALPEVKDAAPLK